jgi:glycosyltransferase involved in cell wall biosynthesis
MNNNQSRILYLVPDYVWEFDPILHSQVLNPAQILQSNGFKCAILAATRESPSKWNATQGKIKHHDVCIIPWFGYPNKPSIFSLWGIANVALKHTYEQLSAFKPSIIYTRSFLNIPTAQILARRLGATHVHDVRGLSAAESAYERGSTTFFHRVLECMEMRRVKKANKLLCVSHRLADWLHSRIGRTVDGVVPCCIDSKSFGYNASARMRLRSLMKWGSDTKVLVYCGGINHWQRIPDILKLMKSLCRCCPSLRLLFLTTKTKELQGEVLASGIPKSNFFIQSVPHHEISDWLSAADMAVILRENALINQVASPIKMAEYLACGLPVICSDGIGDLSSLINQHKLGVVITSPNVDMPMLAYYLKTVSESNRIRCINFAGSYLNWSNYLSVYRDVFIPTTSL